MKVRKIRGHRRRQRQIQDWIESSTSIHFEYLKTYQYWYSDIVVHPWCDISLTNSEFPEPRAETRNMIIQGLETIYDNWMLQLDAIGEPYYLKIWLYEPRLSKSQVVCAIGDKITYYDNMFDDIGFVVRASDFTNKASRQLRWKCSVDYQVHSQEDLLEPAGSYASIDDYIHTQRLLRKLRKGDFRVKQIKTDGDLDTLYLVPQGVVWLGEKTRRL